MIKPPAYAIGEDRNDSPYQWIVSLSGLFLMARTTKKEPSLHLLPHWGRDVFDEGTEREVTSEMIKYWAMEIANVRPPTSWRYYYDSRLRPPWFLYLTGADQSGWEGILRLKQPGIFWGSLDEYQLKLVDMNPIFYPPWDSGPITEEQINSGVAEAIQFAERYLDGM